MNGKTFSYKFVITIVICASLLLATPFVSSFIFERIFPNSIYVAVNITRKFVAALKARDIETAQSFIEISDKNLQFTNDMAVLIDQEEIINYEELYLCDSYKEGEIWRHFGVLYYKDISTRFKAELILDANKSWKIHEFIFLPEFEPGPFENCE